MLHNNISDAIVLIEKVKSTKQQEKANTSITRNNNVFFENLDKLVSVINTYLLVKEKFKFVLSDELNRTLNKLMRYAYDTIKRGSVTESYKFKDEVEKVLSEITLLWQRFFGDYNRKLFDDLNVYKTVVQNKQEIQVIIYSLSNCKEWSKLNAEKIEKYFLAKQEAEKLVKELNLDDEIIDFLKKANEGKAYLSDLNPKILDWIKKENLSNNIAVSIRF